MALRSWVEGANLPGCDFPLENLPYGVFRQDRAAAIGVPIGSMILDLRGCAQSGLLSGLPSKTRAACSAETLNPLMTRGPGEWTPFPNQITALLKEEGA